MKKIVLLLITAIIMISCGGNSGSSIEEVVASKDLQAIRASRTDLTNQVKELENKIKVLDDAITELDENAKLPLVTTMTVEAQKFNHYLELQGDVMTDQNVLVYPEMAGTLFKIHVKEGQSVSKGQLLASIDDGGLSSQVAQLKTQLALAQTTFERQKRLWDQNIGSEIQYLQAKSQYEAQ
ncbi:MAG: biotin/lipoyl-binding protein, partial [Bacteroidota bacterium]